MHMNALPHYHLDFIQCLKSLFNFINFLTIVTLVTQSIKKALLSTTILQLQVAELKTAIKNLFDVPIDVNFKCNEMRFQPTDLFFPQTLSINQTNKNIERSIFDTNYKYFQFRHN